MRTMAGTFTLLYDSLCPICRREVDWLKRRDRNGRLATIDIAAPGFDPAPLGLTSERVVARLHGIEADGRVVEGMAAMRGAWRAVGLGWLIAPTGWPLVRYLFDGMYLVFARYRVPLGRLFGRRAASCDTDRCTPR
jgi:predicted DCC family thiol-disulfide oxidoreductase YuxK